MKGIIKVFTLSLAIVMAVCSFATADVSLNVQFYSQVDYWSGDELVDGVSPPINIGNSGCMMTCFSMALKYYGVNTDPRIFNNWLKIHDGYVTEGVNTGFMNWDPGVGNYAEENGVAVDPKLADLITGQNYQAIHNELEAGYPVIVKVPLGGGHWMLVVEERDGQFYCWDPIKDPVDMERVSINKHGPYEKYLTIRGPIHHQVLKFSDSPDCFLQSNNSLWLIPTEEIYARLGFVYDCNFSADWSYLTELDASQRGNYDIRSEAIMSISNPSISKNIAYKVIEKVGPVVCSSMFVDPTKIYLFGDDNSFHHVASEQVYYDLGYADDWSDVVEISPDLFMLYCESYEINSVDDASWISFSYASIVPLSSGWTYRVGHAFTGLIFSGGNNAAIIYQGQEVSLSQAINNGWIYYKAYCYDNINFYDFEIAYGQFSPRYQYFLYSFVSGAEFVLYGFFESVGDKQAVQDMDSVAENDSRFKFKELYSLETIPDWSQYWTLRKMAYQVSPSIQAWFNHATSASDSSIRYVTYFDPDTGQWTNWQRVY